MAEIKNDASRDIGQHFDRYFAKTAAKIGTESSLQVSVHSDLLGISYAYPQGAAKEPHHIASIGKVFTSVLLFMLIERGTLHLDDRIELHLSAALLKGLFTFKGVDYAQTVTVKDLVAHTSGAADYFEDRVVRGKPFTRIVVESPDTLWTPDMLLDFARENQNPVAKPGETFHYSDTGYILLGKIIESVTGKAFHENLRDEIFFPLGMNDSYLLFHDDPVNLPKGPLRKMWLNGTEVSGFTSVSCDWAGGGIVSTAADLLAFQSALHGGRLVSKQTLESMQECNHKFRTGIYYGLGMMEIRFEEFFFLLKGLPRIKGHIGILSTHMFYDKASDTHIIMNFGSTAHMTESFKALIEIMGGIRKAGGVLGSSRK